MCSEVFWYCGDCEAERFMLWDRCGIYWLALAAVVRGEEPESARPDPKTCANYRRKRKNCSLSGCPQIDKCPSKAKWEAKKQYDAWVAKHKQEAEQRHREKMKKEHEERVAEFAAKYFVKRPVPALRRDDQVASSALTCSLALSTDFTSAQTTADRGAAGPRGFMALITEDHGANLRKKAQEHAGAKNALMEELQRRRAGGADMYSDCWSSDEDDDEQRAPTPAGKRGSDQTKQDDWAGDLESQACSSLATSKSYRTAATHLGESSHTDRSRPSPFAVSQPIPIPGRRQAPDATEQPDFSPLRASRKPQDADRLLSLAGVESLGFSLAAAGTASSSRSQSQGSVWDESPSTFSPPKEPAPAAVKPLIRRRLPPLLPPPVITGFTAPPLPPKAAGGIVPPPLPPRPVKGNVVPACEGDAPTETPALAAVKPLVRRRLPPLLPPPVITGFTVPPLPPKTTCGIVPPPLPPRPVKENPVPACGGD
ncbi:hypothetical protein HIM_03207 [Hirsutella minnesotensis 3608]|nr:hypothetical protein HIM_03207 [Hirsutella minnesotensis 3608]